MVEEAAGVFAQGVHLAEAVGVEGEVPPAAAGSKGAAAEQHRSGGHGASREHHTATTADALQQESWRGVAGGGDHTVVLGAQQVEGHGSAVASAAIGAEGDRAAGVTGTAATGAHALTKDADRVVAAGDDTGGIVDAHRAAIAAAEQGEIRVAGAARPQPEAGAAAPHKAAAAADRLGQDAIGLCAGGVDRGVLVGQGDGHVAGAMAFAVDGAGSHLRATQ